MFRFGLMLVVACAAARADHPARVLPADRAPADRRLDKPIDLHGYFPFTPPASKVDWEKRRKDLRTQVLVAAGLWPLPDRGPVSATIHGRIEREGYTVEKVYFASLPGHYVSGNLYRPGGNKAERKRPVVLLPHGHWANGRFHDAGPAEANRQIEAGAERHTDNARFFLQAMGAQLARMGCVAFHYDMIGFADSAGLDHSAGFNDAGALLRLQSLFGLQTWNSLRALDFVLGLPDVDPTRVGVTGASGGGTQTFILGAIDDRVRAAFPAVMISTAMQGGCVCENAPYLRIGTGNVELAGLFAPKPMAMTGADDWTRDIETKGLPELKALYRLYGAEDRVTARSFPKFGHNYNCISRELMYSWFNKHLGLGQSEPIVEQAFVPVPPRELSVFDAEHPRPKDAADAERLKLVLMDMSDRQIQPLLRPESFDLKKLTDVVRPALQVMLHDGPVIPDAVQAEDVGLSEMLNGLRIRKLLLGRKGQKEQVPTLFIRGAEFDGTVVVWVHPTGKTSLFENGSLTPTAQTVINRKAGILVFDAFGTGELTAKQPRKVNADYAGFTFGYNRPLVAERVHDIITAVAYARGLPNVRHVHLVGWGETGPWVVLAKALIPEGVTRTAADLNGFRFENVTKPDDPMMLPGAVKYGGLPAFAVLGLTGESLLQNGRGLGVCEQLAGIPPEKLGNKCKVDSRAERADEMAVIEWALR